MASRSPPLPLHQRHLSASTVPSSSFRQSPPRGHSRNLSLQDQHQQQHQLQNPFDERVVGNSYAGWDSPRPAPRPPSPPSEYSFDDDTEPDPGAVTPEEVEHRNPWPLSPPPRTGSVWEHSTTRNRQQERQYGAAQGYRAPGQERGQGYSYYGENASSPKKIGSVRRADSGRSNRRLGAMPATGLGMATTGTGGQPDDLDQWYGSSQGMYDNYGFHNNNYNRSSATTSGLEKARDFGTPYKQQKTICGMRRRVFWIIFGVMLLVVAVGVGIGIGVGVGIKSDDDNGNSKGSESSSQDVADKDGAAASSTQSTQSSLGLSGSVTLGSSEASSRTALVVASPSDSSVSVSATSIRTSHSSTTSTSTSHPSSSSSRRTRTSTSSSATSTSSANKQMVAATVAATSSNKASATTSSSSSAAAAASSDIACPGAQGKMYSASGSDFQVLCNVDYTGAAAATDLANGWTSSFDKCLLMCAEYDGCTACGWGPLPGDNNGGNHRCWLKNGVDPGKGGVAHTGWEFAVLTKRTP